jgi:hypothetical protein
MRHVFFPLALSVFLPLFLLSKEMARLYVEDDALIPVFTKVYAPTLTPDEAPAVRVVRASDYRKRKRWSGEGLVYLGKEALDVPIGPLPYDSLVAVLDRNGVVLEVGSVEAGRAYRPNHAYVSFIALKGTSPRLWLEEGVQLYELRLGACYPLTSNLQ